MQCEHSKGVLGQCEHSFGVLGQCEHSKGVLGQCEHSKGVLGQCEHKVPQVPLSIFLHHTLDNCNTRQLQLFSLL